MKVRAHANGVDRFIVRAIVFLVLLAALAALLREPLQRAFHASPYLNGLIAVLFAFGAAFALRCLYRLRDEWRSGRRAMQFAAEARSGRLSVHDAGELLTAPSFGELGSFFARVQRVVRHGDAANTLPVLLDSLAARGEDARALVRFIAAALVLTGLIGTFYGLLLTTEGVRTVLTGLGAVDNVDWLAALRERLTLPMAGMGTGFATSLFGLVTSVSLGFIELQLFHAQNAVNARIEALVVADLVPLWQTPEVASKVDAEVSPRYLLAVAEAIVERLDRVAALLEAEAQRDLGGQLLRQSNALEQRVAAQEDGERERSNELLHQLRVISQFLARSGRDAPAP